MSGNVVTLLDPAQLPARFESVEALEEFLSRPSQALIDDLAQVDGDIMILGVAGKMGPTLARLAKNAAPHKRVIGVARFSDPAVRQRMEAWASRPSPPTCWTAPPSRRCRACPTSSSRPATSSAPRTTRP